MIVERYCKNCNKKFITDTCKKGRVKIFCCDKCRNTNYRKTNFVKNKDIKVEKTDREYLKKRKKEIDSLMVETGFFHKYGLVAEFYDRNDIPGLYKKAEYEKQIGRINTENKKNYILSHCEVNYAVNNNRCCKR